MLGRVFGCCRVVFNDALRVRGEAYSAGFKLSDSEIQRRVITEAKTTASGRGGARCPVWPWSSRSTIPGGRGATSSTPTRASGKGRRVGRPRMKSKKDHRQSFRLTRNGFSIRPNGQVFVAKVGEVRVRWSRDLPGEPSSVTIIREPDGHYYASFVVDVASTPLPAGEREAGVDVGISRLADYRRPPTGPHRRCQPEALGPQVAQAAALGAGEVPPTERISQQRQGAAQGRHRAQRGGAQSAGLSPQAGFGVGSREPSDPRRGSQHRGHGPQSPARASNQRCGMGAVRAGHRRESGPLRSHRVRGVALAGVEQDVLGVRASSRRTAACRFAVDVPGLSDGPRSGPQRRQGHSRRRAGGETKRLPRKWAEPPTRFRWSIRKTSHPGGAV